jgi:hypothetical protein
MHVKLNKSDFFGKLIIRQSENLRMQPYICVYKIHLHNHTHTHTHVVSWRLSDCFGIESSTTAQNMLPTVYGIEFGVCPLERIWCNICGGFDEDFKMHVKLNKSDFFGKLIIRQSENLRIQPYICVYKIHLHNHTHTHTHVVSWRLSDCFGIESSTTAQNMLPTVYGIEFGVCPLERIWCNICGGFDEDFKMHVKLNKSDFFGKLIIRQSENLRIQPSVCVCIPTIRLCLVFLCLCVRVRGCVFGVHESMKVP